MLFGMPLHPLIVHFPIVLMILLPIFVAGALWAIRRGTTPRRAWSVPVTAAAALLVSAFLSSRTGEAQEDKVETVVAEAPLHSHEEAAERFVVLAGVLLAISTVGLLRGTVGQAARIVTAVGAVGLVVAGAQVGHTGGLLVYQHGAASAYTTTTAGAPAGEARTAGEDDDR